MATAKEVVIRRIWKQSLLAGEAEISICGTTTAEELEDVMSGMEIAMKQIKREIDRIRETATEG